MRFKVFGLAMVAMALTACVSMPPPIAPERAEQFELRQQTNKLILAARVLTNKTEIERHFQQDLLKAGILPVLIAVENRNASGSFIIEKEKIGLVTDNTFQRLNAADPNNVATGKMMTGNWISRATAGTGLAGAIGETLITQVSVVRYNLAQKEFGSATVGPGESREGFLFVQFPKEAPFNGLFHVLATMTDSSSHEVTAFDLKVPINIP